MRSRRRFDYPVLNPRDIADHVEGHCTAYVIKSAGKGRRWNLEFQIQLKLSKQVKDHDFDTIALRRGLWLGFEDEDVFKGWHLTRARITESTLTLAAVYRRGDLKRLQTDRKVCIAHLRQLKIVGPASLAVRDLNIREPGA